MNFGGPVWHCSVSLMTTHPILRRETLAREVLDGIGDAALGEWTEDNERAFHIRRRLTPAESRGIGPVLDVRGSLDAKVRVAALAKVCPPQLAAWAEKEAAL